MGCQAARDAWITISDRMPPAIYLARRVCAGVSLASLQFKTESPAVNIRKAASCHIGEISGIAVIQEPRLSSGNGSQGAISITGPVATSSILRRKPAPGYFGISILVEDGSRARNHG